MRITSILTRAILSSALFAAIAACGSSSGVAANNAPVQPQAVSGVQTPSQISVVTAK